jgi:hypothetical protein
MAQKLELPAGVRQATVEATIIRADGSVESLGVIAALRRPTLLERIAAWLKR